MNKPLIRFKGFENEWLKTPFSDFVQVFSGLTYNPTDVDTKGTLVLRSSNVKNSQIINADNVYVKDSAINVKNVERGDIIMVVRNGSKALIGKHAPILDDMPKTVIGAFMACLKTDEPYFNNALFDTKTFYEEINKNAGATINQITNGMFREMEFIIPEISEQHQIGIFFQQIDQIIYEAEREIGRLEKMKQASLQKMFPRPGATTPEIRFAGFSEPWVEVKLGTVGTFRSNGVNKLSSPDEIKIGLLNYMDVYNKRTINSLNIFHLMQVTATEKQVRDCNIQMGDIFFTPSSETADDIGHALVIEENLPMVCYSYHLVRFRPNEGVFYLNFPNYSFESCEVRNQLILSAQGVQRYVLRKEHFENLSVHIPSIEEQKAIGEYFRNLDSLISAKRQKLAKLRNIKQACLDKMFVNTSEL